MPTPGPVPLRYAESLKLFECKTGLSTLGYRQRRVAMPHPNAGMPGYDPSVPGSRVGGRGGALGAFGGVTGALAAAPLAPEAAEKAERWRALMRRDPEVADILRREQAVYDAAVAQFERQLAECGIARNGSKITMDLSAPGHVRTAVRPRRGGWWALVYALVDSGMPSSRSAPDFLSLSLAAPSSPPALRAPSWPRR